MRTGPEIGEKVPEFTLPDQFGRNRSLHDLTGPNGFAAGLQPQRRLVTLLPQSARRAATHSWSTESARNQRGIDYLRLARSSQ